MDGSIWEESGLIDPRVKVKVGDHQRGKALRLLGGSDCSAWLQRTTVLGMTASHRCEESLLNCFFQPR